jgi:hypothetical protein
MILYFVEWNSRLAELNNLLSRSRAGFHVYHWLIGCLVCVMIDPNDFGFGFDFPLYGVSVKWKIKRSDFNMHRRA